MSRILRFGESGSSEVFYFETNLMNTTADYVAPDPGVLRDNFANLRTSTVVIPGTSGGFDNYGNGASPGPIGKVEYDFTIVADSEATMDDKLQEVRTMAAWGVQNLYRSVDHLPNDSQYCRARINDIDFTQRAADLTHIRQRVKVVWQVSEPFWLGRQDANSGILGTMILGTDLLGGVLTLTYTNDTTQDYTVNVLGNAANPVKFTVTYGSTIAANSLQIQRIVNGAVVDRIDFPSGVANDIAIVDASSGEYLFNGSEASGNFDIYRGEIFELKPGANILRITTASNESLSVQVEYESRYR